MRTILKYYGYRWPAEVDNWWLKQRFGLGDYRVQTVEAIKRWHSLVCAAYAFVQVQRMSPLMDNPQAVLQPLGEVWRAYQQTPVRQTVCYIAQLVRQGLSDEALLKQLLPP